MRITLTVLRDELPITSAHPTVTDAAECAAFLVDDQVAIPLFIRRGDELLWTRTSGSISTFRDRVVAEANALTQVGDATERRRFHLPRAVQ